MDLLEKASVILTPTAYNNGEALCVKPSDGSGDFDFSRNSAATRVNAQGLVENVQILSSNLVQNGDFSEEGVQEVSNGSFSQEGVQLVTNENFDTDSDWNKGTGWSISGGKANATSSPSGQRLSQFNLGQTINRPYKITISVSNLTQGGFGIWLGGANTSLNINTNGNHTIYLTPINTAQLFIFTNGTTSGSIDNVSVREVGQDWVLTSGATIGENKLDINANAYDYFARQLDVSTIGKTYKVSVDAEIDSGRMILYLADTNAFEVIDTSGSYTFYIVADGTQIRFRAFDTALVGSITNISVKEVGQNWNFDANWSIGNNKAISTGTGRMFQSIPFLEANVGTKVKVSFDIVDYTSAGVVINCYGGVSSLFQGVGSYSFITTTTNYLNLYVNNGGAGGLVGSITNLSVIAITDDTNLPRINYEGFSYQDALGSEEVVNGTFDNGGANWSLGNWTAQNNTATINGQSGILSQASPPLVSGKKYKWTFEITEYNSGSVKLYSGSGGDAATYENSVGIHTQYFVANGTGKYFYSNSFNGSITNVSVKEYLGQSVVPNSGCGSWLFESQSTNLVRYSNDFSNANWNKSSNYTVQSNIGISPDGSLNASTITNTNGSGGFVFTSLPVLASTEYTVSFYAKRGTATEAKYSIYDGGDIIPSTSYYADITDSKYTRVSFSFTSLATSSTVRFYISRDDGAVGTVYVYGAQVEQKSYATSYIPTSGSIATRNQDVCTNGGSLATINSTEGTLYFELNKVDRHTSVRFIGISDNTAYTNRVQMVSFANSDLFRLEFVVGGTSLSINYTENENTFKKYAITYDINFIKLYVNGTKIGQVANTIGLPLANTFNSFDFGRNGGGNPFFGKTKALAVWKEALSDSELQSLTTI